MARKRELIQPNASDDRYARRDERGRFTEVEDVGSSLGQDRKKRARGRSKRGHGDRGDR